MTATEEQQFLTQLEKKLWTAADKLLPSLDAANYKHVVLGLVFLKYISDAFDLRRRELEIQFPDKKKRERALEDRDRYISTNTFWVPDEARWQFLQDHNKTVIGGERKVNRGKKTIRSVGMLIDHALEVIERDNPRLKNMLNKHYAQLQIDQAKLAELIDLISTIPFAHKSLNSRDILGHVYEYFLGQFALAEGKKGGQFYTPKSIVRLIVMMLEPYKRRVYDPAMGSGGFFVQSEQFIHSHRGNTQDIHIFGQEYNQTTWKLAAMNTAIRGLDCDFGKRPANTFTDDQFPDHRFDFVMANPPFNMKEWDAGVSDRDPRWKYGAPPTNNANFAWLQHILHHLAPSGSAGLLLANGSMSSQTGSEGEIRRALVEKDLVECMCALPGQLFTNVQIPACIWFLTKNKTARTAATKKRKLRDRRGEVLFIDARAFGHMKTRIQRDFSAADLTQIADAYHDWQTDAGGKSKYKNIAGFCKSVSLKEIAEHDFILTPGRYVGMAETEQDQTPFAEKMTQLSKKLHQQMQESKKLDAAIRKNLTALGFGK